MEVSKSPHCPSCLPSMYYNSPFVLSAPLAMKNSWCCNVLVLGLMCCHSPLGPPRGDGGALAVGRSPACTTSMLLEAGAVAAARSRARMWRLRGPPFVSRASIPSDLHASAIGGRTAQQSLCSPAAPNFFFPRFASADLLYVCIMSAEMGS